MAAGMIARSAARAVRSLLTPGVPGLFLASAGATLLALAAIGAGAFYALDQQASAYVAESYQPLAAVGGGLVIVMISLLLFPVLLPFIVGFFEERIAHAIERSEYPLSPPAANQPFWEGIWADLRFALWALLLNLLCLPLYLLPGPNLPLFLLLNGYLLGKQFFAMAALRHVSRARMQEMAAENRLTLLLGGCVVALCTLVPLVNLAAPFWGVALMVHLFQRLREKGTTVTIHA